MKAAQANLAEVELALQKAMRDEVKQFAQTMVDGHKKVAAEFRKESQSGSDTDLKAWAAKTLPTVESHLKRAEMVNRTVHSGSATH
jgi:putative membrane protein